MDDYKKRIEAVLYTLGKFVSIEDIAKYTNIGSLGLVKQFLSELKKDYEHGQSSLEIQEQSGLYKLAVKGEFLNITHNLISESELDNPTVKTLAIIAYKQPIEQSAVVKIRGNMAYLHIKRLKEQNFILSEKKGRTRLLSLNKNFYDYFDINKDELKDKLENPKIKEALEKMFS